MDTGLVSGAVPWADLAIAATQALIALALLFFTLQSRSIQLRVQRATKVQEWGARCIAALADVDQFYLVAQEADDDAIARRKYDLLRCLSALIDEGRIFFKNVDEDRHGHENRNARRGLRPKILDPLIAVYRTVEVLRPSAELPDHVEALMGRRKHFVDLLQSELEWLRKTERYRSGVGAEAGDSIPRPPPPAER